MYKSLDDKALFDQLNKAGLAEKLKSDPDWELFKEGAKRVIDMAVDEFAVRTDPKDLAKIIQLQVIIKKYKFKLFSEIEQIASEGELAFEEAKHRGILRKLF